MTKSKAWLHAFRLRTLPLSFSGIIFGSFIAYGAGLWNTLIFVFAMLTTVLFQILSNLANDLGDSLKGADNAGRVGPERAVQSGVISLKEMKNAVILFSILSFISAGLLIYFSAQDKSASFWIAYAILAVFCVIAAITYTIGKRAYGYNGLGDLFVFIFFGLVSVLGVYNLYPSEFNWTDFRWENFLPATTIGLLSVGVLNLNNMRDRQNDARVGKRTMVVKLGGDVAKVYHGILILGAIISCMVYVVYFQPHNRWMYLLLIPMIILFIHIRTVMQITSEKDFDPELKKVALSAFITSILFAVAVAIHA